MKPHEHAVCGDHLIGRFNPARLPSDARLPQSDKIDLPGLSLQAPAFALGWQPQRLVFTRGRPYFHDARARQTQRDRGNAAAWLGLIEQRGEHFLQHVGGHFAVVVIEFDAGRLTLATDRFGQHPLFYREQDGWLLFSERPGGLGASLCTQGMFNYFHAHVIGAPDSVYEGVFALPAASVLIKDHKGLSVSTHWRPKFAHLHQRATPALATSFRRVLSEAVERTLHDTHTGCFLSGGTDSSTVVGLVSRLTGARVATYSIGFDVAGYDELEYAQTAAAHFDCAHHAHTMHAEELLGLIPTLAAATDQPFGNSSLAPTFLCAQLAARHGTRTLLAGDGGDELFGGNTRYAEQLRIARWQRAGRWLHTPLTVSAGLASGAASRRLSRIAEVLDTPLPDRLWRHNLLRVLGQDTLFDPAFLAQVDTDYPMARLRTLWRNRQQSALIDTMLAFDWQVTLADNDLPKVRTACALAGIGVEFPLLDEHLVDFSLAMAPTLKVRGMKLRHFFKYALRDFLPRKILRKQKHGFGLPFGPWLMQHQGLRDMAGEAIDSLANRGVLRRDFNLQLIEPLLKTHPAYFGEIVWLSVMLEYWLRSHHPGWQLR